VPVPLNTAQPSPRRLLVDQVYDALLDAIYTGQLQPGEKLNDAELATWLGVSRTPIRQALQRLESQGVVETEANRWTRVTPIDLDRFRRGIPVVAELLRLAGIEGTPNITAADLTKMKSLQKDAEAALPAGDNRAVNAALVDIAMMFRKAAANPVLDDALSAVLPRLRRVVVPYLGDTMNRTEFRKNSKALFKAVEARDAVEAGDALATSFSSVYSGVAEYLISSQASKN
jgi:DNA-binding GntR family transcriptional regulator